MSEGFGRWKSEAAFESEFRREGKDRIFNTHIAHRRLYVAVARLFQEVTKPLVPLVDRISRAWPSKS